MVVQTETERGVGVERETASDRNREGCTDRQRQREGVWIEKETGTERIKQTETERGGMVRKRDREQEQRGLYKQTETDRGGYG